MIKYNCIAYNHCLKYLQITTALFWFACLFYQTAFCDGLNKSSLERDCTCESYWIIRTLSGGYHHSVYRVWHMRSQIFPFLPYISHGRIAFAGMRSCQVLPYTTDWIIILKQVLNPLTPRSDKCVTYSYNIHKLSIKQPMRLFNLKILSLSNTNFSWPMNKEMCGSKRGELTIRSWEFRG